MLRKYKIFIGLILVLLMISGCELDRYTTKEKVVEELQNNYNNIMIITEHLLETEYTSISIQSVDYIYGDGKYGTWYVSNDVEYIEDIPTGNVNIENENIVDLLSVMFNERGYSHIGKNGNTVYFQLCANKDSGSGLAYITDDGIPTLEFLTKYEKIQDNWYYYEEDFNEWKKMQSDLSQ